MVTSQLRSSSSSIDSEKVTKTVEKAPTQGSYMTRSPGTQLTSRQWPRTPVTQTTKGSLSKRKGNPTTPSYRNLGKGSFLKQQQNQKPQKQTKQDCNENIRKGPRNAVRCRSRVYNREERNGKEIIRCKFMIIGVTHPHLIWRL